MQGLLFLHCSFTKGRKTHWAAACKRENVLEFCLAVDLNTKFMVMSAEWHRQKDSLPSTLLLFRRDLSNRILADLLCPGGKEQFSWKERAISTCYERKRGREGERKEPKRQKKRIRKWEMEKEERREGEKEEEETEKEEGQEKEREEGRKVGREREKERERAQVYPWH